MDIETQNERDDDRFWELYQSALNKAQHLASGPKGHDYNSGCVILDYTETGVTPRALAWFHDIWKKTLRLKSLLQAGEAKCESIEDTYVDLINYTAFSYSVYRLDRERIEKMAAVKVPAHELRISDAERKEILSFAEEKRRDLEHLAGDKWEPHPRVGQKVEVKPPDLMAIDNEPFSKRNADGTVTIPRSRLTALLDAEYALLQMQKDRAEAVQKTSVLSNQGAADALKPSGH